ncbi:MAG: AbrB/MazE/SpoVT family DNA-binding domain-containing protein [Gammaproteobacteria bacterium]|nr:AbrB/MazE/SpoVT family DNA-binding domain-containing protein [Gammaproteobacteria bacterium]
MSVAKLTSKFQVTIPAEIRRKLGLHAGDTIVIDAEGDKAVLRPIHGGHTARMRGLGKSVWARLGGGESVLRTERESWERE